MDPEQQPADESLEFDHAESADEDLGGVACTACQQPVNGYYYQINGNVVCVPCREELGAAITATRRPSGTGPRRFTKLSGASDNCGSAGASHPSHVPSRRPQADPRFGGASMMRVPSLEGPVNSTKEPASALPRPLRLGSRTRRV